MRQKLLDNGSEDLIVNHTVRKFLLCVNKADPCKEEAKCLSANQMGENSCQIRQNSPG